MKTKSFLTIGLVAAMLFLYTTSKVASNPSEIEIQGTVWNSAGDTLGDVYVKAYRDGREIGQTKTSPGGKQGNQGSYVLRIDPEDGPFDLIYTKFGLRNSAVPNLSGRNNHNISKVMFRPDQGGPQVQLAAEFADQYLKSMQSIEPVPR
jgi:hypothetical protein